MMAEYALTRPSAIMDEAVEDRVYEQKRLRGLNTRLRAVFEQEQANNTALTRTLNKTKENVQAEQKKGNDAIKKYEDALKILSKEKPRETKLRNILPLLNQDIHNGDEVRKGHTQAAANVDKMIGKKKRKLHALEEQGTKLLNDEIGLAKLKDEIVAQGEKYAQDWERQNIENAKKEAELAKANTLLSKARLEKDFFTGEVDKYGNKGVEDYFDGQFENVVEKGVEGLNNKYLTLFNEQLDEMKNGFQNKLTDAQRRLDGARAHIRSLEDDIKLASEDITDATRRGELAKAALGSGDQEMGDIQDEIRATEREVQAALVVQQSILQDDENVQKQLGEADSAIKTLEKALQCQENELDELRDQTKMRDDEVSQELANVKAERDKLIAQLEDSRIFVGPEIDKYKALLEVAEVNLGSPAPVNKKPRRH